MRRILAIGLVTVALTACASPGTAPSSAPPVASASAPATSQSSPASGERFVNVVKLTGIGWFNRMEQGIAQFKTDTGIDASQTGADDASPEKQVKIIEDLIVQKPTAITVVPNDPASVEGVIQKARDAGIIVVTHEASTIKNANADIEAFDNKAYGAHIMDNLAPCMGNKGKYVAFVGRLTAQSHMEWVGGALAQAQAKYPGIERIGDPLESQESPDVAYAKTKEVLAQHPDITGIEGSASVDVVGIGRAIDELGLQDKVCVMGTSIPSITQKYLDSGAVDKIFFWDPALAGQAMMKIAQQLASGQPLAAGTDLGLEGYKSLVQSTANPLVWLGSAWVDVTKDNAKDYPF